ncbi:MAG TPA: hypothetical protein PLP42_20560 [Acidobacteriota bacterium]|nr:hypothetical protein [Acidobacteriota bacterium]
MKSIFALSFLLISPISLFGEAEKFTLAVKHDHLWGSCEGRLVFEEQKVRYETEKKDHAQEWDYLDIQQIAIEPNKVVVLTYRDRKLYLGKDEKFTFEVIEGPVNEPLRAFLEEKLTRPLVSSVLPEELDVRYRIPVKHRKILGGSEGVLELSEKYVVYRTGDSRDARVWRYDELLSIGSTGPYQLRITAMEQTGGEYAGGRNFVFDLKQKLSTAAYDYLWDKINRPRINALPSGEELQISQGLLDFNH